MVRALLRLLLSTAIVGLALGLVGCEEEGPTESEQMDLEARDGGYEEPPCDLEL